MTIRDPTPLAPTCPVCASRDRVERHRPHWLCGACWTLFRAGQDEWDRTRPMREHYEKQAAKKARIEAGADA